jgi:hypothetical protein
MSLLAAFGLSATHLGIHNSRRSLVLVLLFTFAPLSNLHSALCGLGLLTTIRRWHWHGLTRQPLPKNNTNAIIEWCRIINPSGEGF